MPMDPSSPFNNRVSVKHGNNLFVLTYNINDPSEREYGFHQSLGDKGGFGEYEKIDGVSVEVANKLAEVQTMVDGERGGLMYGRRTKATRFKRSLEEQRKLRKKKQKKARLARQLADHLNAGPKWSEGSLGWNRKPVTETRVWKYHDTGKYESFAE